MGVVRPDDTGVEMEASHQQYQAALQLLAAGAVIKQSSATPLTYRLSFDKTSVPLPGGVVQQLLAHEQIRVACKVSGEVVYVGS